MFSTQTASREVSLGLTDRRACGHSRLIGESDKSLNSVGQKGSAVHDKSNGSLGRRASACNPSSARSRFANPHPSARNTIFRESRPRMKSFTRLPTLLTNLRMRFLRCGTDLAIIFEFVPDLEHAPWRSPA